MQFNRISKLLAVAGIAGAALAAATPAFAATNPSGSVNATVTVQQTSTLALSESTLAFGSVAAGGTSNLSGPNALTITTTTNDANGASVTWTPPSPDVFSDGNGHSFNVSGALTLGSPGNAMVDASAPTTYTADPGTSAVVWNFSLAVPGSALATAYAAPFSVVLIGS